MTMQNNFVVKSFVIIHATPGKIWDLLINPEKIKLYLYGSNVHTDWNAGSEILFIRDRLHPMAPISANPIVDKGRILEIEKEKLLKFSFYSSMEGYRDLPENYSLVTYALSKEGDRVKLEYCRSNIPVEIERNNQDKFMPGMMAQIKMLAES